MISIKVIKEVATSPPQALWGKADVRMPSIFIKLLIYENQTKKTTKGPSSVKTNEQHSKIPQLELARNIFQVLSK